MSWFALLLLAPAARASDVSGFDLPAWAGSLAVPGNTDAAAVAVDPSAVVAADGPGADLAVGDLLSRSRVQLDGQSAYAHGSGAVVPAFAARFARDKFGGGLAVGAPMARRGAWAPNAPMRFQSIEGRFQLIEGSASAGYAGKVGRTTARIGAALRYDHLITATNKATPALGDTYPATIGPPDADEGWQIAGPLQGHGFGATLGARIGDDNGAYGAIAVRTSTWVHLYGPITADPGGDWPITLDGVAGARMQLPAAADLTVGVPFDDVTIVVTGGWTGWHTLGTVVANVHDLKATGDGPLIDRFLQATGLSERDFTTMVSNSTSRPGMRDAFRVGGEARITVHDVDLRAGAAWSSAAVPDGTMHPGNQDFAALDAHGVAVIPLFSGLSLAASADLFVATRRHVDASLYSPDAPADSGLHLPSGNGTYGVRVARFGVDLAFQLP